MKIRFDPHAEQELDEAIEWYNEQKAGLGLRFFKVVDETILRAARYPLLNPEIGHGVRRALVKKFPYGILYSFDDNGLLIFAVAHLHRVPFYWLSRLK